MTVRVTQRQLDAFFHFVTATPQFLEKGAAAIIGNLCQESGENLDSTMFRAHPDASGGVPQDLKSGGIAEWLGSRKTAYIAFSQRAETQRGLAKGSLLNDLFTQCDFLIYELKTPEYAELYNQLTADTGRSVATLAMNFMLKFERPKLGPTDGRNNRIAHAEAVFARAQLIKAASPPPQAPPAPIPQAPAPSDPPQYLPPSLPPTEFPTISATSAGRRAAEHGHISDMLSTLRAERDDINQEIAFFERMDAALGNLIPQQELKAIPSPSAISAATQRKTSMDQTKTALASTGIWGGIIAAGIPLASLLSDSLGHSVDPKLQMAGSIIGGLVAIYGRMTATTQITGIIKK